MDIMGANNTFSVDFKLLTYLFNKNFTTFINPILLQK